MVKIFKISLSRKFLWHIILPVNSTSHRHNEMRKGYIKHLTGFYWTFNDTWVQLSYSSEQVKNDKAKNIGICKI